jgi:hypothetical protein
LNNNTNKSYSSQQINTGYVKKNNQFNQNKSQKFNSRRNHTNDTEDNNYYHKRHQPQQLVLTSFLTTKDKNILMNSQSSKSDSDNSNNKNDQTESSSSSSTTSKINDKNDYHNNHNKQQDSNSVVELKEKLLNPKDYNPIEFNIAPKAARFFVIKSYSEDDVHRSIKYNIWCSTEHGNRRLDSAFLRSQSSNNNNNNGETNNDSEESSSRAPVYLFFSVNGSGHFCGMAEMVSRVDYAKKTDVWSQDKWRGCFQVKWIYVKDVPNSLLRNIKLENNDNKPVTNSRDTQEIPFDKGKQVLKIFHTYAHTSSIFDDFDHYEKRQDQELNLVVNSQDDSSPTVQSQNDQEPASQTEKTVVENKKLDNTTSKLKNDNNNNDNVINKNYANDGEKSTSTSTNSDSTATNTTNLVTSEPKLVATSS